MLDLKLAKTKMENEEGMNHLWVRIYRDEKVEPRKSEIQIRLPEGLYRSPNLNGYAEDKRAHIIVEAHEHDAVVEVFTQDAIPCGEVTIIVSVLTADAMVSKEISLQVVEEEEMDTVEIDEQVVERVKALSSAVPSFDAETNRVSVQPWIRLKRDNEFSYLEKKYRVDYGHEGVQP